MRVNKGTALDISEKSSQLMIYPAALATATKLAAEVANKGRLLTRQNYKDSVIAMNKFLDKTYKEVRAASIEKIEPAFLNSMTSFKQKLDMDESQINDLGYQYLIQYIF